jgi:hypothetical protein
VANDDGTLAAAIAGTTLSYPTQDVEFQIGDTSPTNDFFATVFSLNQTSIGIFTTKPNNIDWWPVTLNNNTAFNSAFTGKHAFISDIIEQGFSEKSYALPHSLGVVHRLSYTGTLNSVSVGGEAILSNLKAPFTAIWSGNELKLASVEVPLADCSVVAGQERVNCIEENAFRQIAPRAILDKYSGSSFSLVSPAGPIPFSIHAHRLFLKIKMYYTFATSEAFNTVLQSTISGE